MRGELEAEQNCSILTPTLMAITAFLSPSPGLLNRGPGAPASLGHVPHSSIFSPTDRTSCAPSYIIIWRPLFFLRASQFRTQFNPSTDKVISWYSSTGCTCYLHRCISYFDSLAGVSMLYVCVCVCVCWGSKLFSSLRDPECIFSPSFDPSQDLHYKQQHLLRSTAESA